MTEVIYPVLYPEEISENELKEIMKNGKKVVSTSNEMQVTNYFYNGKIYVTDIKEIEVPV